MTLFNVPASPPDYSLEMFLAHHLTSHNLDGVHLHRVLSKRLAGSRSFCWKTLGVVIMAPLLLSLIYQHHSYLMNQIILCSFHLIMPTIWKFELMVSWM